MVAHARANDGIATFIAPTTQAKGSAKTMVTVVATQDLQPGDVLWRFGPETAQDEPLRGKFND